MFWPIQPATTNFRFFIAFFGYRGPDPAGYKKLRSLILMNTEKWDIITVVSRCLRSLDKNVHFRSPGWVWIAGLSASHRPIV